MSFGFFFFLGGGGGGAAGGKKSFFLSLSLMGFPGLISVPFSFRISPIPRANKSAKKGTRREKRKAPKKGKLTCPS